MQLVEILLASMERAGGKGKGDLSSQGLEVAQLWRSLGSLWGGSDCDSWDGPKGAAP